MLVNPDHSNSNTMPKSDFYRSSHIPLPFFFKGHHCAERHETSASLPMALQMEVRIAINRTSHHFGHASPSNHIAARCPLLHIGIATHCTPCRTAWHPIASRAACKSHRIATRSGLAVVSHQITSHCIATCMVASLLAGQPASQPSSHPAS